MKRILHVHLQNKQLCKANGIKMTNIVEKNYN